MKAKIFHIVLLVTMFASITYFPAVVMTRQLHRHKMKAKIRQNLDEKSLSHFTFTRSVFDALDWEDGGREFIYKGDMYDVIKTSFLPNGDVKVVCINDHEEEALLEQAEKASKDDPATGGSAKKLKKFNDLRYTSIEKISINEYRMSLELTNTAKPYTNHYINVTHTILTPPPRV